MVLQTSQQNNKKYNVESRVYKDTFWYRGWFKNLKPHWSEWGNVTSVKSLRVAARMVEDLEMCKGTLSYKAEYRITKNIE